MRTNHEHAHAHHGRSLQWGLFITALFMGVEIVGGLWSGSLALLSDGIHMATDVAALGLGLFASWIARRPATARMSFGYQRVEILGALISGLSIWLLAGGLIYEAIRRLSSPPEIQGPAVLVVATLGLLANGLTLRMLHGDHHHNLNVRAAYLHVWGDLLGSVSAMVAGAVLWFTHWNAIDPLMTFVCAALLLYNSWTLVREAVGILLDSTPSHIDPHDVRQRISQIPGVGEVHDLHIWTATNGTPALSVHLVTGSGSGAKNLLGTVNALLSKEFEISHTTVQIESPENFDPGRCYDCGKVVTKPLSAHP